ncbi:MAG: dynamin family protein [Vicinamibacterales bacterium]|nr:dynamin family protein [Vicinamibacterales bacterium]
MLERIVDTAARRLLADEREALAGLQQTLAGLGVSVEDQSALEQSVRQLDQLFLLVVIGEFNAGKSAFINALAGARLLEEGVTPTTTRVQILAHGATGTRTAIEAGVDVVTAPVAMLEDINIVDTPGTNAIYREHERLTNEYVPRADLVLFVTSADRPFTESERAFLQVIRDWGKKIVVVINKVDILETPADVARVEAFVAEHAHHLLGFAPELFAVSARRALAAKLGDPAPPLAADRFADLERYILRTLDQRERLRLKLLNPLGVGRRLVATHAAVVADRLTLLASDLQTIEDIEGQLAVYRRDLEREFTARMAEVDNVLQQFENRGIRFFDDTLRLGRIADLLNKSRIQAEFERDVVGDVPAEIERLVGELIDWLVASELRQWQVLSEHVNRRRAAHEGRLAGDGSGFQYDRARLLDTVGRASRDAVESYDRAREAAALADSVRMAVAGTALAQAGAVGLGTVVAMLASTTAADVTGLLAASLLAVVGLLVIPARRGQAKRQLREKIASLRTQLTSALTDQFRRAVDRSVHRLTEAVSPYTRFVRAEQDQLSGRRDDLQRAGEALARLHVEVERQLR